MGIEVIIGAVAAAASVATGVASYSAARKASKERKEANEIASANQKNEAAASRRKAAREARIRRAMILQQSENAGLGIGGSGTQGAIGVVGTNFASNAAQSQQQSVAAQGINRRNQRAADYDFKSAQWGAFGNMFNSALSGFQGG
jgi:hypothetical protein